MQSQKIAILTFCFTAIKPFILNTCCLFFSLENLFKLRFITMRVAKFTVKRSKMAIPWGYHNPENVHFRPVSTDPCSSGSEILITVGQEQCRATLVFPISYVFGKGVNIAPKSQKWGFDVISLPVCLEFHQYSFF